MDFKDIQAYLDTNKDTEEVKSYMSGINPMTADRANEYLNTDDGKKLLKPKLDSYMGKGLDTWKVNNLNTLVDQEVKKRFPDADPRDVELGKMKTMLEQMQKDSTRKELTNKALKTAQEKKLPTDLIDYFIGNDEDSTNKNIEKLIATMAMHDEAIKLEFAKGGSYVPPAGKSNIDANKSMRDEVEKYFK